MPPFSAGRQRHPDDRSGAFCRRRGCACGGVLRPQGCVSTLGLYSRRISPAGNRAPREFPGIAFSRFFSARRCRRVFGAMNRQMRAVGAVVTASGKAPFAANPGLAMRRPERILETGRPEWDATRDMLG